jgi:UDP-glucuronate decarboxylase
MDARRLHGADARIVRIFNTYGPRMAFNDGRVVSNFLVQALRGEPITIYGDGSQTRSFCFVSDLVEGLIAAARLDTFDSPVNLGNPRENTILELAQMAIATAGRQVELVRKQLPADDPKRRCPDIGKARRLLGFEPKVALEDGLRATCDNFKARLDVQSTASRW